MGLATGTGLTNGSDVIEAVRVELTTNRGWSEIKDLGTVGANTKEVWLEMAAANTVNGERIVVGMTMESTNNMFVLGGDSALTPTEMGLLDSPDRAFLRTIGTPNRSANNPSGNSGDTYRGVVLGSNQNAGPADAFGFDTGASYLNHWILTTDQLSPLGQRHQYCYVVVEVSTGQYVTFGFGEMIKLGASAWTGGAFFDGTRNDTVTSLRHQYFLGSDMDVVVAGANFYPGYVLNEQNFIFRNDSPQLWNPWCIFAEDVDTICNTVGYGPRKLGQDLIGLSPAPFSGQAQRVPARMYVVDDIANHNEVPLCEAPDVFHTNIADLTPGSTLIDDGDRFLVVPYFAKSGAVSSGNLGFLVRNPDL